MSIALYRIDDRLIHGQVVVGWGQPLDIGFIILVDDQVAASEWEQELYRMGVPPEMEASFVSVSDAAQAIEAREKAEEKGIVLTSDISTMRRLVEAAPFIRRVNIGGIHFRAGRTQRFRYVFLTPEEEEELRQIAARGVEVSAQDVPAAHRVPLDELLERRQVS
jgi:mannose/fructose/N-acetylgalactosamine-specific phosphotransferase system component IIB